MAFFYQRLKEERRSETASNHECSCSALGEEYLLTFYGCNVLNISSMIRDACTIHDGFGERYRRFCDICYCLITKCSAKPHVVSIFVTIR